MAVQVIAYEVRMARWRRRKTATRQIAKSTPYPLVDDLERFTPSGARRRSTGFIRENHPGQVMNKLRRLLPAPARKAVS